MPRHTRVGVLDRGAVKRATALLVGMQRPLVIAGNGVIRSGGSAGVRALAEQMHKRPALNQREACVRTEGAAGAAPQITGRR